MADPADEAGLEWEHFSEAPAEVTLFDGETTAAYQFVAVDPGERALFSKPVL